jgi:beta-1,3-galactosyltransferase 1
VSPGHWPRAASILTCLFLLAAVAFVWPQNQSRDAAEFIHPNTPTALLSPADACPVSNAKLSLLVIVCSATGNDRERNVIRETWAQKALTPDNVKVLFLVGRNLNDSLQATLAKESQIYGDLIQENFIDTYANLTIKSLMLLKWFTTSCQHVPYVMKTDDDMFVNLNRLSELVARNKPGQPTLIGALICGAVPIRDPYNKWYVPEYMYHKKLYPNYLSGTGYLMGNVTAQKLLKASVSNLIFHLEDIYLTGILAAAVDIKPHDDVGFTYVKR